jgi:hypothetical protein
MPADANLKKRIEQYLRPLFPEDTVDVSDGYHDNIHVVVVSRKFDGMTEKQKQDYLWGLIDKGSFNDPEKAKISLIIPASPGELK